MHCSRSLLVSPKHHSAWADGPGGARRRWLYQPHQGRPGHHHFNLLEREATATPCAGRPGLLALGLARVVGGGAAIEELTAPFAEISRQVANDARMADPVLVVGRWR
jgi:hypothetical protein